MKNDKKDYFTSGLKVLMASSGWKMKPFSEALGLSESWVRDLLRNGSSPSVSNAYMAAKVLGLTVDEVISIGESSAEGSPQKLPSIPIVGRVGAGDRVPVINDIENIPPIFKVIRPSSLGPRNVVAVEVQGDSMEPLYFNGDILFFTRSSHNSVLVEDIGHPCIIEDDDGLGWVKIVKPYKKDPSMWNLISINESTPTMAGVKVKWASRVILALQKELITMVNE